MKRTEGTTKRQREQRTRQELQEKADHLFYEWQMLTTLEQKLLTEKNQILKNAFIESGAIHGRNLVKFLYNPSKKPRPDDAIAEDYFPTPDVWQKARPTMPKALEDDTFGRYANKQIAHMTYSGVPKKRWDFTAVADAIQPAVEKFISMIRNDQLADRWRNLLPRQPGPRWDELKDLVQEKQD